MAATKAGKILITEAKRGLGLEMIKQLSENSCPNQHIFAACRDPDVPNSESKELARKHPSVITIIRLDADDPSSVKDFAKKVGSLLGNNGLNQLVNNADRKRKLIEIESIVKSFKATNCNLPEYLPYLQMAAKASGTPGMSSNKAAVMKIFSVVGSISTMPSIYEQFPTLPYGASKAGCNMLTVLAAEEFKADEILCMTLHPGWVKTELGGVKSNTALESMEGMLRVIDSLTEKQHAVLQTTCKLIL
uniref:Zgc:92161 n=1 Tax=Cyprinus carpio TaxID=7962 RepID=A0A8C1M9N9_CYPCA